MRLCSTSLLAAAAAATAFAVRRRGEICCAAVSGSAALRIQRPPLRGKRGQSPLFKNLRA